MSLRGPGGEYHGEFWNFVQAEEAQALGIEIVILFDLYSLFDVDISRVIIDLLLLFIHLFSLSFLGSEILLHLVPGTALCMSVVPSEKW